MHHDRAHLRKYIQRQKYVREMKYDKYLVRQIIEALQLLDECPQYIPPIFNSKKDNLASILVAPDKKIKSLDDGIRIMALTSNVGYHQVLSKNYSVLQDQVIVTIDNITTQQTGAIFTYWFEKCAQKLNLVDICEEVSL